MYSKKLGKELIPEVMGGLPTPRIPAEIVSGVVTNKEGKIVDVDKLSLRFICLK